MIIDAQAATITHSKDGRVLPDDGEVVVRGYTFAGDRLIMQTDHAPYKCDQIEELDVATRQTRLVSTGACARAGQHANTINSSAYNQLAKGARERRGSLPGWLGWVEIVITVASITAVLRQVQAGPANNAHRRWICGGGRE